MANEAPRKPALVSTAAEFAAMKKEMVDYAEAIRERQWKPGTLNKVDTWEANAKIERLGNREAARALGISRRSVRRLRRRAVVSDSTTFTVVKIRPGAGL